MADVSRAVDVIFRGIDGVSSTVDGILGSFRNLGSVSSTVSQTMDEASNATKKLANNQTSAVAASSDLYRALQLIAASAILKWFVDANVSAQQFSYSMTLIAGSTVDAAEKFKYIKDISQTLGLRIDDAAHSFVNLSAATKGTALEGQRTQDIFEAVAKAMAILGRSTQDTNYAFLAIQQIVSKGVVQMEELRGQLGERLPGSFQIAASAMGLTTAELNNLVKTGTLTAEEFLPRFAAELNKTFGDTRYVDTFVAAWARLKNSIDILFQEVGDAGTFDFLKKSMNFGSLAADSATVSIKLFEAAYDAVVNSIRRGDLTGFTNDLKIELDQLSQKYQYLLSTQEPFNQTQAETARLMRQEAEAGAVYQQSLAETSRLSRQNVTDSEKLADQLAQVGVTSKDLGKWLSDSAAGLLLLAENTQATAEVFGVALKKALSKANTIDDLNAIGGAITEAFVNGKLGTDQFGESVILLAKKQAKLLEGFDLLTGSASENEKQLAKTAKAAQDATDKAQKYGIELEKIASNERIKTIEAEVKLKVADLEATTARIKEAFASINTTIQSTGDIIGKIVSEIPNLVPHTENFDVLLRQLDIENKYRQEALDLQKQLTEAQIANLNAQTRNLLRGDSIINIDGAGLQPHLEAFMWEILKAIQVRVNSQGLQLLLGVQ